MEIKAFGIDDEKLRKMMGLDDPKDDDVKHGIASKEAVVVRIQEAYDHYKAEREKSAFKVGDWVTVRKGYNHRGAGLAYLVIEVNDDAAFNFNADAQRFGWRTNIRTMSIFEDDIVTFWGESYVYEKIDINEWMATKK